MSFTKVQNFGGKMYNYCFKDTRYGAPLLKAYMCSITISIVERRGVAHKWEDGEQP